MHLIETACIHPQIAYHGNPGDINVPYDIGIEVSLRMKKYKNYLLLKKVHKVNIATLVKNRTKTLDEFNPAEAVIDSKNIEKVAKKSTKVKKSIRKSTKVKKSIKK